MASLVLIFVWPFLPSFGLFSLAFARLIVGITELAIDKRKFLLSRLYQKQPIPQINSETNKKYRRR